MKLNHGGSVLETDKWDGKRVGEILETAQALFPCNDLLLLNGEEVSPDYIIQPNDEFFFSRRPGTKT